MTRPDGQTGRPTSTISVCVKRPISISVRSDIPARQVAEKFPALCQAGSPDDVREIYGAALKGIPLIPVSRVPAALPVRMENQYFALDIESPAAHEMLEQGYVCSMCLSYLVLWNLNCLRYCAHETGYRYRPANDGDRSPSPCLRKAPSRLMALRFTTHALNKLKVCGSAGACRL